jgi:kynurenine formamidase
MNLLESIGRATVFDLEQPRFFGMPTHPAHKPGYFYALYRRHRDSYRPATDGPRSSASGVLTMMEHSGTHIDALCHQARDLRLHGDVRVEDVERSDGYQLLGAETIPLLLGRGVLLDVAAWKGLNVLPCNHAVTGEELEACAAASRVEVRRGDVLLIRTGYGGRWNDPPVYMGCAGVSRSGTIWAGEQGVVAVGADNLAWDALHERDPENGGTLFAHTHLLVKNGIYIIENLNLEQLGAAGHHVFVFVGIPLKLRGATGSPIRPLALVEP